jgi:hypothetical protein
MIRTINATHYVMPLREGGSLPAIVEGDDDGTWVVKFRGAGQGPRALIAELLAGEIGRALGLPVPELVFIELDARMAKTEPDPEIRDLLRNSEGLNLALDYLPGSITFDPLVDHSVVTSPRTTLRPPLTPTSLASAIVWFDALVTNVDRTPRNPNLLVWHRQLYLIDHGAALYFHHNWDGFLARSRSPFAAIKDHVLLPWASELRAADEALHGIVTADLIDGITAQIPDAWLGDVELFASIDEHRAAYRHYLLQRLEEPREWLEEAIRARALLV